MILRIEVKLIEMAILVGESLLAFESSTSFADAVGSSLAVQAGMSFPRDIAPDTLLMSPFERHEMECQNANLSTKSPSDSKQFHSREVTTTAKQTLLKVRVQ